jgi:hypothetical protein
MTLSMNSICNLVKNGVLQPTILELFEAQLNIFIDNQSENYLRGIR